MAKRENPLTGMVDAFGQLTTGVVHSGLRMTETLVGVPIAIIDAVTGIQKSGDADGEISCRAIPPGKFQNT